MISQRGGRRALDRARRAGIPAVFRDPPGTRRARTTTGSSSPSCASTASTSSASPATCAFSRRLHPDAFPGAHPERPSLAAARLPRSRLPSGRPGARREGGGGHRPPGRRGLDCGPDRAPGGGAGARTTTPPETLARGSWRPSIGSTPAPCGWSSRAATGSRAAACVLAEADRGPRTFDYLAKGCVDVVTRGVPPGEAGARARPSPSRWASTPPRPTSTSVTRS